MKFTYLISNFVAIGLGLSIIWRGKFRFIYKILPVLIILSIGGLINGLAEAPALRWGIWTYNEPKTLGITIFGTFLETYLYCILVPVAIGSVALILASRQDNKHAKRKL